VQAAIPAILASFGTSADEVLRRAHSTFGAIRGAAPDSIEKRALVPR